MRQVLAMYPLARAIRNGPFLAGYLKNLVLSDQGAKHLASMAGPATTSGPAASAGLNVAKAMARTAPMPRPRETQSMGFISFLHRPFASGSGRSNRRANR